MNTQKVKRLQLFGPVHMSFWYLSHFVNSDGSDETAHMRSLTRAATSRIHSVWNERKAQAEYWTFSSP